VRSGWQVSGLLNSQEPHRSAHRVRSSGREEPRAATTDSIGIFGESEPSDSAPTLRGVGGQCFGGRHRGRPRWHSGRWLSIDLQSGPLLPRSAYVAVPDEPAVLLAISTLDQGAELILVRDYDSALDSNSIRIEFNDEDIGATNPANSAVLAIEIDAGLQVRAIVTERRETPDGPILLLELT